MNYHLLWKKEGEKAFGSGRVQTWDGKVVDTTPALKFLIGRPFDRVMDTADQLGARLLLEEGGRHKELRRMGKFD